MDLANGTRSIGVQSTSQWAELAGAISNGSFTKTDAGLLRLSGANTYTGATTISGGTLQLGSGGTTGSLDPASTISIASGATLVFSRSDAYGGSFANAISGTGAVRVTSGTLVMTGSNGYTGRTTIAGGVLGVGSANALAGTGTIAFAGGALQYSEANQTDYSSRIKSSTAAIAIDTNGQSVTFASGLDSTNSSGLTKSGAGTLTLTASNAYTGTTTINSGTLQVGSGGTTGSLGAGAIVNNGSLVYNRSTGSVTFPDAGITGSGSMSVSSAGRIDFQNGLVVDLAGRQDWVASANSGLYQGFTLATSATATLRSQAGISMSGVLGSVGSDSGGLNIDTSSGNANVDLNVAIGVSGVNYSLARLSVTSGTGAITLSNTTGLSWGTGGAWIRQIALNGRDVNVSANIPYFGTITVTNSGSNSTFSGNIGTTGSTGTVFTKAGSGALTLTGTNTYAGATAISGGILRVASSGRLSNTSGITINGAGAELNYNSSAALTSPITFTQGTLSGTGTIGTAVTAGANDILSPGNSPGAQSFTSGLTWDPAGTYLWEVNDATGGNGTGWDIINVSGGSGLVINATSGTTFKIAITSLSGTAAGNAANFSATTSGSWTILSSASGISGFAANKFNLDRSAFANTSSGSFTISQVASGTNQTLVLAYNTISALSSSTSSVTGFRVMQGESTTTAVNLLNAGPDATGYSLSPAGGLSLVSGSTGTLAGGGTQAITFGYASTAATGARSGTVSFTNTGNSGDTTGLVSVSGAVVTDRVVTASVVDFGLVHLGASGTGTSTFTSTGSDNDFTRITVGNGTGGGLTVSGSDGFVFNGSGGSSRTVAGTFATAGVLSGTISLANASAEAGGTLPGQVPGTTGLAYSASVFSGTATWNVAGGGSWGSGASGSWTSTGGVQAAPGTFIGYANTDVAIFAGTQGGTSTVLLNNATPSLAAISFTNTANRYVIDEGSGGSLTLATSSGKPTIDVVAGGLHEIKTAILGSAGLAKLGGGTLVLSGSNGFTGGTDAAGGTLAVNGFLGGPVDVANGATLAGSGQVGGAVTVAAGGILAPGNSPGTLTMGSGLSLADASILSFELDATNFNVGGGINDLIAVTGNFTLDGLLNVAALGAGDFTGVATGAKWTLFTYTGDLTNNGLTLNSMPSLGGDRTYAIDTSTSGVVALIVVPEPATVAMAVVGVALAAGMGARRRKTRAAGR